MAGLEHDPENDVTAIRRLKESVPADTDQRYLHFFPFLFIQWTS